MSKKVIIVGGVAGGASTAARLRRLDELPDDKPIYAFCQEGFRAYISQMNLLQRDYDVRNLIGGIKTYIMATATQEELKEMAKNPPYRTIF
ncbi:MAG: hypothetical protein GPJ51_11965 [Candidatus Heimdallarchaeota archaeon]|nr:hypothetical protein [Candidatus Heimdallarchaeota archaeon]